MDVTGGCAGWKDG